MAQRNVIMIPIVAGQNGHDIAMRVREAIRTASVGVVAVVIMAVKVKSVNSILTVKGMAERLVAEAIVLRDVGAVVVQRKRGILPEEEISSIVVKVSDAPRAHKGPSLLILMRVKTRLIQKVSELRGLDGEALVAVDVSEE